MCHSKHPSRKAIVPESLDEYGPFRRIQVDLYQTFRNLPRRAGTGPSGFRNEYLTVLTHRFEDARAATVSPAFERFGEKYVNAELPGWFYYVFCSIKLLAPIKEPALNAESAPDVRPLV